jgi:hypothetical protein
VATGARTDYLHHEHLDKLRLTHMNGRVYDPELGRFLSADPLIQFPESTPIQNCHVERLLFSGAPPHVSLQPDLDQRLVRYIARIGDLPNAVEQVFWQSQ